MAIDSKSGLGTPVNPHVKSLDPVTEFNRPIKGDRDQRTESDALRIGGDYSPGVCVVRKAGIPVTWDKRKGYGFAGASLIYTGDDLSEFDVEFTMTTQTQIEEWKVFAKKYFTKRASSPQNSVFLATPPRPPALGVYHPLLAEVNINSIVFKHIHQFDQEAAKASPGKWIKVVEFYQYRAPKPLLGKPAGSTPAASKPKPTARDAVDLEQRAANQTVDALEKELAAQ